MGVVFSQAITILRQKKEKQVISTPPPLPLILPAPLNSLPSPFALPPSLSKGGLAQSLNPKARHPDHEVPLPQPQQKKKKKKSKGPPPHLISTPLPLPLPC